MAACADEDRAEAFLGLHEGIPPPVEQAERFASVVFVDPDAAGCPRWPEHLRLRHELTGEKVPGRCRATNLCDYCAKLAAVENTEMLWIDAVEQGSPPLWLLLTTNVPVWDGQRWERGFEHVVRAVRRRWPEFEYACLIEYTTGYGELAGGRRRPHANVFARGVPVEDGDELAAVAAAVWVPRMVDRWDRSGRYVRKALEQQRVFSVAEDRGGMRGLTRYVGLHFQKESQAPPKGLRLQRFRASRGYFVRPRLQLREEARASLRQGRLWWRAFNRAEQLHGRPQDIPEWLVELVLEQLEVEHQERERGTWELVREFDVPAPRRYVDTGRLVVAG